VFVLSAWLTDDEDVIVQRVSQRARASVNLTLNTVEELQVSLSLQILYFLHTLFCILLLVLFCSFYKSTHTT